MPSWGMAPSSGSNKRHLFFRPEDEQAAYLRVVVHLISCGCRDGKGHRFLVNPTGASMTVSVWPAGEECLKNSGMI